MRFSEHLPARDDSPDGLGVGNVIQRVRIEQHDVSQLAWLQAAQEIWTLCGAAGLLASPCCQFDLEAGDRPASGAASGSNAVNKEIGRGLRSTARSTGASAEPDKDAARLARRHVSNRSKIIFSWGAN